MRGHGNLIIHSAIRSVPKIPLGVEASNWLYLLHHGIVICQGRSDFADGCPASGEYRQTNMQETSCPTPGPEHVQSECRMGFENAAVSRNLRGMSVLLGYSGWAGLAM